MKLFTQLLLSLYKHINKTGALKNSLVQSLFISSYFAYKKYLEDANAKFVKNYPHIFRNGHILDIGANIGYTSHVFSKALAAPYQVFAFEPEQNNLQILKKVAQRFAFTNKLVITPAAVGAEEGEIEIWQNDGHHADHRILTSELRKQLAANIHIQKTPLIAIDNFLKKYNVKDKISFIKIDVQGYELPVCLGMQDTLRINPNCVVGFEYCPSIMKALGYAARDLIQFFHHRNFLFYELKKNGTLEPLNLSNEKIRSDFPGYFDIICTRKSLIPSKE